MSHLKIGLIGLGDIAQKAYLPVVAQLSDLELYLSTRAEETLRRIGDALGVPEDKRFSDYRELTRCGLDAVFIHSATDAHYEMVSEFLRAGCHVFVDKPVDYHLERTEALYSYARAVGRLLYVGFNRRYAPMYQRTISSGQPDYVIMQKNRVHLPGDVRTFILDDFIHVVDTLVECLSTDTFELRVNAKRETTGLLSSVMIQLISENAVATGLMNRDNGVTEEVLEWMGNGSKYRVTGLREMVEYASGGERHRRAGDWESVGKVRGFEDMLKQFLQDVRCSTSGPSQGHLERMQRDLDTHRLCEEIVKRIEA